MAQGDVIRSFTVRYVQPWIRARGPNINDTQWEASRHRRVALWVTPITELDHLVDTFQTILPYRINVDLSEI